MCQNGNAYPITGSFQVAISAVPGAAQGLPAALITVPLGVAQCRFWVKADKPSRAKFHFVRFCPKLDKHGRGSIEPADISGHSGHARRGLRRGFANLE